MIQLLITACGFDDKNPFYLRIEFKNLFVYEKSGNLNSKQIKNHALNAHKRDKTGNEASQTRRN